MRALLKTRIDLKHCALINSSVLQEYPSVPQQPDPKPHQKYLHSSARLKALFGSGEEVQVSWQIQLLSPRVGILSLLESALIICVCAFTSVY